jgi:hypothetical protein
MPHKANADRRHHIPQPKRRVRLKLGGVAGRETRHEKRCSWRKLHIGFDAMTGRIVASILTDRDVDDAAQVGPLLDQITDPVELFLGDGAYDRTSV